MKKLTYIFYLLLIIIWIYFIEPSFARFDIPWWAYINHVSTDINYNTDIVETINYNWFKLLSIIKLAVEWIFVIFMVYTWAQMVWSMGENEEDLSKSKRQIRYALIAILFINMPWTLYNAFHKEKHSNIWQKIDASWYLEHSWEWNMFFDFFNFWYTFWDQVVWFMQVWIFAIAVVVLIYQFIRLMDSRWREERVTETKNKITYSVLALVFVWMIQAWKTFAFDLKTTQFTNIFSNLANLALFFAGPIAFFFLSLAAYYYITSAWDEEKVKKAKSIVINTIFATLILVASYTFLLDLATL